MEAVEEAGGDIDSKVLKKNLTFLLTLVTMEDKINSVWLVYKLSRYNYIYILEWAVHIVKENQKMENQQKIGNWRKWKNIANLTMQKMMEL